MNAQKVTKIGIGLSLTTLALCGTLVVSVSCAGSGGAGGAGGNGGGGSSTTNTNSTGSTGGSSTTFIIVTALSGSQLNGLNQGLESTNSAGSSVSFTPTVDPNGTPTVTTNPTTQTTEIVPNTGSTAVQ